jgi:hypothetical protein
VEHGSEEKTLGITKSTKTVSDEQSSEDDHSSPSVTQTIVTVKWTPYRQTQHNELTVLKLDHCTCNPQLHSGTQQVNIKWSSSYYERLYITKHFHAPLL